MKSANRPLVIAFASLLTSLGLMTIGGCGSQGGPADTKEVQEQQQKRIGSREDFAKQQKVKTPSKR